VQTTTGRAASRPRKRLGLFAAVALLLAALFTPHPATAAATPDAVLIDERFDAQTDPANFGFPRGAGISGGVLKVTENMSNYTTSVSRFDASVISEKTLDLRFDWKTAITSSGMKTGLEFRDDDGRLVFAIAATGTELRYAVTGPDSDSTTATDALNPAWTKTSFDRSKWYTVELHMDFTLGKVQYTITSKEAVPTVMASGTGNITGTGLAKFVACNYYGTGVQSIDDFRLTRPAHPAYGSLEGSSVYAFGDSIVYGHTYPQGFVDFTAKREGMTLTKYAKNGATIGPVANGSSGNIITQVRSASATAPDFVVFDGSTNDAIALLEQPGYKIGSIGASRDPASFDTTTYAGSLETTIHTMRTKWPTARLVYVAAHQLGSRDWDTQLALRAVNLEAAAKWGVAVADVFGDATLDTRDDAQRAAYTFNGLVNGYPGGDGTGTHPNIGGITRFYVPVLTATLVELGGSTAVKAQHSDKCAGVASTLNEAPVTQSTCDGSAGQAWELRSAGEGYFTIANARSGKCLDVYKAQTVDGANAIQWTCHSDHNQQWELRPTGDGTFQIVARHSGKCLDVAAASTADGARVQQRTCSDAPSQRWSI
jgi:hypothetical protein